MTPSSKSLQADRHWLKVIGWYQILSGGFGLTTFSWLLTQEASLEILVITLCTLAINGYAIYAGFALMRQDRYRPTYIFQATQLLNFTGLGITFYVLSGLSIGVGFEWINSPKIKVLFDLMSSFKFRYSLDDIGSIRFIINLIPVVIIHYLMRRRERIEAQQSLENYSSTSV